MVRVRSGVGEKHDKMSPRGAAEGKEESEEIGYKGQNPGYRFVIGKAV
jgi:hypothetical protein